MLQRSSLFMKLLIDCWWQPAVGFEGQQVKGHNWRSRGNATIVMTSTTNLWRGSFSFSSVMTTFVVGRSAFRLRCIHCTVVLCVCVCVCVCVCAFNSLIHMAIISRTAVSPASRSTTVSRRAYIHSDDVGCLAINENGYVAKFTNTGFCHQTF